MGASGIGGASTARELIANGWKVYGLARKPAVWAADTDAARDQAFNIVNGELFRWSWLWGRIAAIPTWSSAVRSK